MNVNEKNRLLLEAKHDALSYWPKIKEYEEARHPLFFEFPLGRDLPKDPGLIVIRGPRQYGKSTWLEVSIKDTVEEFGNGSALYLNGDEIDDHKELSEKLVELEKLFKPKAKVKRIFIDEISAIKDWEKGFKRVYDAGHLKEILVITTGSNARDLRRGNEKLPGRKGKLKINEYIFPPVSYQQFYKTFYQEISYSPNIPPWFIYYLAGGSPLALNEILFDQYIPDFLQTLVKDWIQGDIVSLGRDRTFLRHILENIFKFGTSPVGYAKLARESGLANNTVASGYIEHLSDLLVVSPVFQMDHNKNVIIQRKPCKFVFTNTLAASTFHPEAPRFLSDFDNFKKQDLGFALECLVAQELQRRASFQVQDLNEPLKFWKSDKHEIDFVCGKTFIEVKSGKTSPQDFLWFTKVFPNEKLTVISESRYENSWIRGITMHEFLMEGITFDFIQDWQDKSKQED
jgi:uncharacterized protein